MLIAKNILLIGFSFGTKYSLLNDQAGITNYQLNSDNQLKNKTGQFSLIRAWMFHNF